MPTGPDDENEILRAALIGLQLRLVDIGQKIAELEWVVAHRTRGRIEPPPTESRKGRPPKKRKNQ